MSRIETHTLQLWPSGDGYEYRGEPDFIGDEPGKGRRLRRHRYNGEPPERWRKGTKAEWASILVEVRVVGYIEHEVLKCDSMLVGDLLEHQQLDEWALDNVTNLYPDLSDWNATQCLEWLDDHGIAYESRAEYSDNASDTMTEVYLDDLRENVQNSTEPQEIYEWWAVTEWLARQLAEIGEPVLDNAYGTWWGRTCTGQAMKMDGTLQEVARRFS